MVRPPKVHINASCLSPISHVVWLVHLVFALICARITLTNAENLLPISDDKLDLVVRLADYCNEIFQSTSSAKKFAERTKNGSFFVNKVAGIEADASFVFRENIEEDRNECIVIFLSTKPNAFDWSQNFDLSTETVFSRTSYRKNCTVHGGFHGAYYDVPYLVDFENAVRDCMSNNTSNTKLIISGHSQGGAIAAIAGVVFEKYNPLVITFGQPPTFVRKYDIQNISRYANEMCTVLPHENYWRFINSETQKHLLFKENIDYDPVPFIPLFTFGYGSEPVQSDNNILWGYHVGAAILLPPGDTNGRDTTSSSVVYFKEEDHYPTANLSNFFEHSDSVDSDFLDGLLNGGIQNAFVSAHSITTYSYKLQYLKDYGTNPLQIIGFDHGTLCNYNDECQGKCIESTCSNGEVDQECLASSDCQAGLHCRYTSFLPWHTSKSCQKGS